MKNIKDQSLSKIELKKVLLRVDLNVPLENGKVVDDTRIHKIIDTIIFLLKNNTKIIIVSHVGRPKGKKVKELSLKPVGEDLRIKLNVRVKLIKENIYNIKNKDFFKKFKVGKILSILVASHILPFSKGTFRSNLNNIFLLLRFFSFIILRIKRFCANSQLYHTFYLKNPIHYHTKQRFYPY